MRKPAIPIESAVRKTIASVMIELANRQARRSSFNASAAANVGNER